MMGDFPLFPEQASTMAPRIDTLYFALVGITGFFSLLIFFLVMGFAIRYRERKNVNRIIIRTDYLKLELFWTIIPFVLSMGIFGWAAKLYLEIYTYPEHAMEIYVVGKQWMWKIQHPSGNREINELHVPTGRPIKLIMTSQDVIHDFYVPAFRVKQDVLPGRYTMQWFEATKPGEYHLFCAEYCGTGHSRMIGKVTVMEPDEYERWIAGSSSAVPMASTGEQLFSQFGCQSCHKQEGGGRGPSLVGLFGKTVELANGERVVADQSYLQQSILNSQMKIVPGYQVRMPIFKDQLSQEQVMQLIEYIKSQKPVTATSGSN